MVQMIILAGGLWAAMVQDSTENNLSSSAAVAVTEQQTSLSNRPGPMYLLGKQAGIYASAAEIEAKKKFISQMFPNAPVLPDSSTEQSIIADKYFLANCPVKPTEREMKEMFDVLQKRVKPGTFLMYTELRPILEIRVAGAKPENQKAVQALVTGFLEDEEKNARLQQVKNGVSLYDTIVIENGVKVPVVRMWPAVLLQIQAPAGECLAVNRQRGECVVTVADFNRHALTFAKPMTTPLDSARMAVLDKALNVLYYLEKAHEMNIDSDPEVNRKVDFQVRSYDNGNNGRKITEETLKQLYSSLYAQMFAEREDVSLDMVGSTDSALVDSQYRLAQRIESDKTARRRGTATVQETGQTVRWSPVAKLEDLPRILSSPTDSLSEGQFSKPFKTLFGYFFVRVADIKVRKQVPFDKAREQLFKMAGSNTILSGVKADDKTALAFYNNHRNEFLSPDTFSLKVWLFPEGGLGDSTFDTAKIKPVECASTSLPSQVRKYVELAFDSTGLNELGPVRSLFGTWFIKKTGFKKGRHQLEFNEVKESVKTAVGVAPSAIADIPFNERGKFIRDETVAMQAWRTTMQKVPEPTRAEIDNEIQNSEQKLVATPGFPRNGDLEAKRKFVSELLKNRAWRSEQEGWKENNVIVDRHLLFR